MNKAETYSFPIVSIIVPIYNIPAQVLTKCIDSIINQSIQDIEIILVVDGDFKDDIKVCRKYQESDVRVKFISHENKGVSVCRNEGMENARGEWIAFVDADDWTEPDYLEKLLITAKSYNADIVLCDCFINYSKSEVTNRFFGKNFVDSFDEGKDHFFMQILCPKALGDCYGATNSGAPWSKLYRKEFLDKNNIRFRPDLRRMQDNVFNLYAYECADRIVYFHQPLYHYRKSSASGFARYSPKIEDVYNLVFDEINYFIQSTNKGEMYKKAFYSKIICSFYVFMKMDLSNKNNPYSWSERREKALRVLKSQWYCLALKEYDANYLNAIEKVFAWAMKNRLVEILFTMYNFKEWLWRIAGKEAK